MIEFVRKYKALLLFLLVVVVLFCLHKCRSSETVVNVDDIEYTDEDMVYHKYYYEDDFKTLKEENKALYDSLKQYKDQITYLIKFKDKKDYSTGIVSVNDDTTSVGTSNTFEYVNEPNDTMRYKLRINAEKEPNWYSLDITTNTEYTIVNKSYDNGFNQTTIEGGGEISDVTVFKKKEKTKFIDRFVIGPSVGVGYDPISNRLTPMIGISVTFDLRKK